MWRQFGFVDRQGLSQHTNSYANNSRTYFVICCFINEWLISVNIEVLWMYQISFMCCSVNKSADRKTYQLQYLVKRYAVHAENCNPQLTSSKRNLHISDISVHEIFRCFFEYISLLSLKNGGLTCSSGFCFFRWPKVNGQSLGQIWDMWKIHLLLSSINHSNGFISTRVACTVYLRDFSDFQLSGVAFRLASPISTLLLGELLVAEGSGDKYSMYLISIARSSHSSPMIYLSYLLPKR